jgi:transcriptional regulator with XRE-family HTH domain
MNYILMATGLLFLEKRKSKSLSSADVGDLLDIGESTVRNFENGIKNIAAEKLVGYSRIFDNFLFDKLCRLTIGLHLLFKESSKKEIFKKIEEIRKNGDYELAKVFSETESVYIEVESNKKIKKKEIKELESFNNLKSQIEKFILIPNLFSNDLSYESDFLKNISMDINEGISSYDLDDVLNFLELRKKKPLLIKNDTIEEWEKEIKFSIESILGVTNDIESIINMRNIKEFDYSYLFNEDRFKFYKIIFINVKSGKELELKFKQNLREIYKDQFNDNKIELGLTKISFKHINLNEFSELSPKINLILSSKLNDNLLSVFDNFWAYKLNNGRIVDFLSNKQDDSNNFLGVSDSTNIVRKKIDDFNNLWSQL